MNRTATFALALLAIAAPAAAQPAPGDTTPPPADQPVEPTPPPAEPVTATVAPAPAAESPRVVEEPVSGRPDGFSVGLGLGYDLPADLQQPNITSVRFRLASGLTLEPFAALAYTKSSADDGTVETSTSTTGFEVGADVRLPQRIRGPVDLVVVAGGALGITQTNPDGDNNDRGTLFADAHWGLGLEYWVRPQWVISLTGTNPLLLYQKQKQETPAGDTTTSQTTVGLIWEPDVVAMLHLFF